MEANVEALSRNLALISDALDHHRQESRERNEETRREIGALRKEVHELVLENTRRKTWREAVAAQTAEIAAVPGRIRDVETEVARVVPEVAKVPEIERRLISVEDRKEGFPAVMSHPRFPHLLVAFILASGLLSNAITSAELGDQAVQFIGRMLEKAGYEP